jgi:murein hydrolase activator
MHQLAASRPRCARECKLVARLRAIRWIAACCFAAWSMVLGRAQGADDPQATIDARERDLKGIENRVQAVETELVGQDQARQSLIAELESREREVAAQALASREIQRQVREQTRVAAELRQRQSEEQQRLASERDRLSSLLRIAYSLGRADALRLILNRQDPAQASRVMSYFAYFNRERVRRIRAVESSAERLAGLASDAEREAGRLRELSAQQDAARQRLEAAKAERAAVLSALEQTIASGRQTMAVLTRDAENLRVLVEHLRQRAQIQAELDVRRDPFASRQGQLRWPLVRADIRAGFASRKDGSSLTLDGVLLATRDGEEVRAVYDGRVVYADWLLGFGMLLVLDHGDGYMTLYGHNDAVLKEVGEWVAAGEPVAIAGGGSGQDGPGLYFAIRRNGEPLDPRAWCG